MSITSINTRPQVNNSVFVPSTPDRASGVAQKIIKGVGAALALVGAAAFIATASVGLIPLAAGIVIGIALTILGIVLLATINPKKPNSDGNRGCCEYVPGPMVVRSSPVIIARPPVIVPAPVVVGRAPAPMVVRTGPGAPPPGMVTRHAGPTHASVGHGGMVTRH